MTEDASTLRAFGHYTLLEELGRGGQGTVWLAEDGKLKRKVALKLLRTPTGAVDERQLERFRREAEAASKLDHPNICALFDAGEVDGTPFLAFRHVEGVTLAERIADAQSRGDDSSMSKEGIQATAALFEKLARALHRAHEQGLIHRDVKPGNVMMTPEGEPIVLDFGLARDELADEQTLTHSGDLVGTPAYMSPEQLMAQRVPLDRRTDVYSLGATLYECLTLQRPFGAPTRAELYQQILHRDPSSTGSTNKQVPRDLQVIVETAMEKDRSRRYQTAADLADDLQRFRNFEPILARPIGRWLRLRRWSQRHPAMAVGALGVVMALLVTLGFLERMRRDLVHTRAIALANASVTAGVRSPSLGVLLALEAVRLERSPATLSPLHAALTQHHERVVFDHEAPVECADMNAGGAVLTVSQDGQARIWHHDGSLMRSMLHPAPVTCGSFSPDGRTIVTGCEDGVVRLWNLDGELLAEGRGHEQTVLAVAFAPKDGSEVVSGAADGTARSWNLRGEPQARFELGGLVAHVEYCPRGQLLVTATGHGERKNVHYDGDNEVGLWTRSGQRLARLEGHTSTILDVAWCPDGSSLATASRDGTARIWDRSGEPLAVLEHPARALCVTFQRYDDEFRILTGCLDGALRAWDASGRLCSVTPGLSVVDSIMASSDGARIVTASWDQSARLFDGECALLREFVGHGDAVTSAEFSKDESELLTLAMDRTARLWAIGDPELPTFDGHAGGVCSAVFSRDQRQVLTASVDSTVRLWSAAGDLIRTFAGHEDWVNSAWFSPDESAIVSASDDGTVRIWRTSDATTLHVLGPNKNGLFNDAAFSTGGDIVAGTGDDGTMLWDARSGEHLGTLNAPASKSGSFFLSFAPNRPWIAIANEFEGTRIWDFERQEIVRELELPGIRMQCAQFSPDGNWIATGSADGVVRIWPAEGGDPVLCLGHQGHILRCKFSPDGTRLATASRDRTARIWDLTGRELMVLQGHTGTIWDASFSADGRRLLTASLDGTVRTWIADPDELVERATQRLARLGRTFSDVELEQYGDLLGR